MKLFRILDPFTLTLITVVLLASFFPAEGGFVPVVEGITTAAIALLFFMHGAKLSREAIIAGGSHWRLHLWVMCSTFVLFPVLGVLLPGGRLSMSTLCSTAAFCICVFCPPPCSLRLRLLHSRAVTSRPRCAQRLRPACWAFSCRRCWSVW